MRAAIAEAGSQSEWARRKGINRTAVSAILNGRKGLQPKIVAALQLKKVEAYTRGYPSPGLVARGCLVRERARVSVPERIFRRSGTADTDMHRPNESRVRPDSTEAGRALRGAARMPAKRRESDAFLS